MSLNLNFLICKLMTILRFQGAHEKHTGKCSQYMGFEIRLCACEPGVGREGLPEEDTFEMVLNVEKEPAIQKDGRRTFYMWEIAIAKAQGNQA